MKIGRENWQQGIGWSLLLLVALILLWTFWPQIHAVTSSEERLEAFVQRLGWFGPLMLIALNTLQIVVAPIPGYVIQAAAGFLYGAFWGGVWASCGLFCGAFLAMWLTRHFGRPLAEWLVGRDRLQQWNATTQSDQTLLWFILLLSPIGDLPYFLAGLANVSYGKMLLLTLLVRIPTVFVTAAIGAGVLILSRVQLLILFTILGVILYLFLRYQKQLMNWIDLRISNINLKYKS